MSFWAITCSTIQLHLTMAKILLTESHNSGWELMVVKIVTPTLCCLESSSLTSCTSLLQTDTLPFTSRTRFTFSNTLGPHCSCPLGEKHRVGNSPCAAFPLEPGCIPVLSGGVRFTLGDPERPSRRPLKVGSRVLGDVRLSALVFWCWNMVQLLSWKKYNDTTEKKNYTHCRWLVMTYR